jgi:hypothetical protein
MSVEEGDRLIALGEFTERTKRRNPSRTDVD